MSTEPSTGEPDTGESDQSARQAVRTATTGVPEPRDSGADHDAGNAVKDVPEDPAAGSAVAAAAVLPPRRIGLLVVTVVLVVALDVITKLLAVAHLEGRPPVRLLGGAVYFTLFRNGGAAFSLATGMTWVFSLVALGVVIAIAWVARKLRSAGWAIGLGLVLSGALGNLIDRIFRAPGPFRGHVIDFISVFSPDGSAWPVFNVADSGICVGGALIVLMAILGRDYDGRRTHSKRPADSAAVTSAGEHS